MFVITVSQPWASLIAHGQKHYLIRNGKDSYYYRGPVFIYSARRGRWKNAGSHQFYSEPTLSTLNSYGYTKYADLPTSQILAMAYLSEIWPSSMLPFMGCEEKKHGDPYTGEYMYMFENIHTMEVPIEIPWSTPNQMMWIFPLPEHLKGVVLHDVLRVPGF